MSKPAADSKSSPSPVRKPTLRQRMSTAMRRGSSFIPSSRSSSPAGRRGSDEPRDSGDATKAYSRPSSIRSVDRHHMPLVVPEDLKKPLETNVEPTRAEAATAPTPDPIAHAETVSAEPEIVAEPPKAELAVESIPAAEPAATEVRTEEEQKPTEESHTSVSISAPTPEAPAIEHQEEDRAEPQSESKPGQEQEEHQHHDEGITVRFSESPRSLSASLPSQDNEHQGPATSGASTPRSASDSNRHLKPLSLNTSQENLHTELSPIPEDERSALEEKKLPFTQPNGIAPPGVTAPQIFMTTPSKGSGGTTPRAMPVPLVATGDIGPHVTEDKGKAKDDAPAVGTTVMPHHDGYFSAVAPMTVPRASDERYAYDVEDPFRDPSPSRTHYEGMPEPETHGTQGYGVPEQREGMNMPQPVAPSMPVPVTYALPPFNEVSTGRNIRSVPSDYTLGARSSRAPSVHNEVQTDETLPLLAGPKSGAADSFSKQRDASQPDLHSAGWIAHALPDSTTYYSHPGMRVTTDINLERPQKLAAVMDYLEGKLSKEVTLPIDGLEIWLHDEAKSRNDFVPVRCWVDHEARALGYWPPPARGTEEILQAPFEDRIDHEYRYWAFMETHPAHVPLPVNSYSEAWDKLTWSYTERLLKSNRRAPPPFTQHESQEMLTLLRSTSSSDSPIQAAIQTRVVARIHRRVVQWKQHFFRPDKPLPRGVETTRATQQRGAPRTSFLDFIVACLCFGIPYLYANRHVYRFDEEGGIVRSAGPLVVVGATICIVAGMILLASVTFLVLPGLDHISRTAGFISIVASVASLAASLIAAHRSQVETQRMAARGGEGLVVMMSALTGDSILPSLPAVFLAWSILSLITGVVLYAFRGSVVIDTTTWAKFASFTRWTTIGVVFFCSGALIASVFAIRR